MSSISSLSASSNGFSGLVSGMNTTELVEKMLEGTQYKLDSQAEEKSVLELKQQLYRDVASQLLSFQSRFFDFANPTTNLLSTTFYNQNSVDISEDISKYLSVDASTAYSGEDITIDYIRQLASATTVTSANTLTDSTIEGTIDLSVLTDTSIEIGVAGGSSVSINLTGSTSEEVRANLESQLAGIGITLEEDPDSGELSLTAGEGKEVEIISASTLATKMTGLSAGKKADSIEVRTDAVPTEVTLKMNLDGVTKNIKIDTSVSNMDDLVNNLNESISNAFGNGVRASGSGDTIKFETVLANGQPDTNRQVTLSSDDKVATEALGIASGTSSKVSQTTKLSDINFTNAPTPNADNTYEFNINGVDFKFGADATLKQVIDTVNNSDAGVTMSYSSLSDKMTVVRDDTGAGLDITMSDTSGNLLSSLFGTGNSVATTMTDPLGRDELIAPEGTDLTVSFDMGSSEYPPLSINLAGKSMSQVVEELEELIRENQSPPEANVNYDPETGRLTITGVASAPVLITGTNPEATAKLAEMFGASEVSLGAEAPTLGNKVEGQNAIVSINGSETERNVNDFEVSGLSIELKETNWDGNPATKPESTNINVEQDIDAVVEGVLSFVNEYNKIVEELYDLTNEPTTYKDFPPLTTEQKNEMTDNEIALWEERAKEGLLRNDDIINDVLQDMRTTMYSKPEGAEFALYEFGISTTENWREGGILVVDETMLREMVQKNPDELEKLFTDEEGGLANALDEIIDNAARQSSASPGSLVSTAGYEGMADSQFTIGREIESIEERIEQLERTYEMEHDRYWSEFNAMEQIIANMNSQSSWLASQFS